MENEKTGGSAFKKAVIAIIILAGVAAGAFALYSGAGKKGRAPSPQGIETLSPSGGGTAEKAERQSGVYTFLVVGMDAEKANSDVIMLVLFDTENMKLNVLNFPRDTYSAAASNRSSGLPHLNLAFAYGGMDGLKREVKNLIGYDFDFYVRVEMDGFVKIINHIGGVEHYIPQDMYYSDPAQNLTISFKKGQTTLNGKQALEFVRARMGIGGGTDIERIERRSGFISSLVDTLLKPASVSKAAELAGVVLDNVKTDLGASDLLFFADVAKSMKASDVSVMTMPFSYVQGKGYVYPNKNALLTMINEYFNPLTIPITQINIVQGKENAGK